MTSRSIVSRSSLVIALVVMLGVLLAARPAHAGRRIVVLDFSGPKAAKFRADVEKAVKKGNTIVPIKKWGAQAKKLRATKATGKNVAKVAAKLKVDGAIVGDVEKRGRRYYLHLRLREGQSGDFVAEVEVVVREPKLGKSGARTIKDELMPAINELSRNSGGKKTKDEEEEVAAVDDEERGATTKKKSGFGSKKKAPPAAPAEEEPEEEAPVEEPEEAAEEPPRDEPDESEARVAAREKRDEDDVASELRGSSGGGEPGERDPRYRPLELGVGPSATIRRLDFTEAAGAAQVQGYKGKPVAGAVVTVDVFPFAFNAKNRGFTRNIGMTAMFDRVIKISSTLDYVDGAGADQTATLDTTEQRWGAGLVYRHPIGDKLAIQASVRYTRMTFEIDKTDAPPDVVVQIPSVDYAMVDPGLGFRYMVSPKMQVGAGGSFGIVMDTGEVQEPTSFGSAKVTAIEAGALASFAVTDSIDIRADLHVTTFGFEFDGSGELSDPNGDNTVDVPTGRDTYYSGAAFAAYHF